MMPINPAQTLTARHIRLHAALPFDHVHNCLIETLPRLERVQAEAERAGEPDILEALRRDGSPLWLFTMRDMGAMLAIEGPARKLVQYEIGNPLRAESMVRHVLEAGLYAPLRVLLMEDGAGCTFVYDQPSDLFGQFGDERVTQVGRDLDEALHRVLSLAASPG